MKKKTLVFFASLVLCGRLTGAELTVHAAASLTDAIREIVAAYEKESGNKLVLNFGASSSLERQIEHGAPGDLFLSADEAKMDALEKRGLVLNETRRNLLSNLLVVIVAGKSGLVPASPSELNKPEFKRIAIGEPNTVPAGIYAREYLRKIELWDSLEKRIVPVESVRAALAAVESGNADAGIVYRTDALISKHVRIAIEISPAAGPRISYPMSVLQSSRQPEEASRFEEYLLSPRARQVFEKFGFIVAK